MKSCSKIKKTKFLYGPGSDKINKKKQIKNYRVETELLIDLKTPLQSSCIYSTANCKNQESQNYLT
jgi:hypothetical protein